MSLNNRKCKTDNRFRSYRLAGLWPWAVFFMLVSFAGISYAQDTITKMRDDTLVYFQPLRGKVISVDGKTLTSDIGLKSGIRKGMRFTVFKEGVSFLHPVTKEPMGRIDTPAGKAEAKETSSDSSTLALIKGDVRVGDALRISEIKPKVLFFQDKSVDWSLGDIYYQLLKEAGRVELIDTPLDSGDDSKILAEAKRLHADAALILYSKTSGKETILAQKLLWVEEPSEFASNEAKVDIALLKDLEFSKGLYAPATGAGDALLHYDLPFRARLVAAGDVDGEGKQKLIISTGRELRIYLPGASLQNVYNIKMPANDDPIWLDTIDMNSDGRDEVIATSINDDEAVSYVYELKGSEFSLIWKDKLFLRKLNNTLIGQGSVKGQGYSGPVFTFTYENGSLKKGEDIKLPKGVNIYDFAYVSDPSGTKNILAYDESGHLNLYNSDGLRIWQSKDNYGGFVNTFKRNAPTVMIDRGEWSVKDKLFFRNNETLVVKRIPLAKMAKGIGFRSSDIKALWWNGFSMEEKSLISGIAGGMLDYAIVGDKLIVISKPLFGLKARNILKGESPLGSMLYIYSLKGLAPL